jgi:hypothetical protein
MIRGAKEGILFLMFNPGPHGTLFNDIVDLASPIGQHYDPALYIQGMLNQEPGPAKKTVTLFNRGERIDANADVVLPAKIPGRFACWHAELLKLPRTFNLRLPRRAKRPAGCRRGGGGAAVPLPWCIAK